MNIKIHQMKCFKEVAESGSFSAASRILGIAQPALSRKIADLETELGKPLLMRSSRGVSLTPAGEKFLGHCRLILLQLSRAEREIALDGSKAADEVIFVVPPALSLFVAAHLVKAVVTDYPDIHVICRETHWDEARQLMESGQGDVALVTNGHLFDGCEAQHCVTDSLYFGGRIDETHHGSAPVSLDEVADLPLILPGSKFLIRRTIETAARERGLSLNLRHEVNSEPLLSTYLEQGLGFTISIWQTFFDGVARGRMFARPLQVPNLKRQLTIVSQPQANQRSAVTIVHGYLRRRVRELHRAGIIRGSE